MEYTEEEIINCFINNKNFDDVKKIKDRDFIDFFFGKIAVPDQYKYIEKELLFIRGFYKNSIKLYSRIYFYFIVAIFTCMYNDGIKIPNKFYTYLKKNRYQFSVVNELVDYFITMFLPYREDLIKFNHVNDFAIARFYQRVGHNVIFTSKGDFINKNEEELFKIVDDYNFHGIYALRTLLIGFYHINHKKYNLNIDMLKNVLNDYDEIVNYMLLNELSYDNFSEELILELFQKNKNKIMIK